MTRADCISREQAQTEIEMNASRYTIAKERGGMGQVEWSDQLIKVSDAVDIIRHLPSVTPQEPRKGHWIDTNYHQYYNDGDIETTELRCSCCNEEVEWDIELLHKPYYCENCGADMREVEE